MAYKYLGPAIEFFHRGHTYKPGDDVDIDDRTAEVMSRYGHRFEGYGQAVAGTPLEGYAIDTATPAGGGAGGNAPGAVRGQTAADLVGTPAQYRGEEPNPPATTGPAPAAQVAAAQSQTAPAATQQQQPQSPPNNANAPAQG